MFKQEAPSDPLPGDYYPVDAYQAANDLSYFEIEAVGSGSIGQHSLHFNFPRHQVTGTRVGNDLIKVTGQDSGYYIQFNLQRIYWTDPETGSVYPVTIITDGFIRNEGYNNSYTSASFHGNVERLNYLDIDLCTIGDEDGSIHQGNGSDSSGRIGIKFWIDGQEVEI